MTKLTTFERATAVSAPEAPKAHTPGPFVRQASWCGHHRDDGRHVLRPAGP